MRLKPFKNKNFEGSILFTQALNVVVLEIAQAKHFIFDSIEQIEKLFFIVYKWKAPIRTGKNASKLEGF